MVSNENAILTFCVTIWHVAHKHTRTKSIDPFLGNIAVLGRIDLALLSLLLSLNRCLPAGMIHKIQKTWTFCRLHNFPHLVEFTIVGKPTFSNVAVLQLAILLKVSSIIDLCICLLS